MNLFQTRYVSIYLFLLIQTVSGKAAFINMNLTQVPVSEIYREEISIDLSRNLISRVEDNTFVLFPRLSTLDLSHNEISFLSDLAFNGTSISSLYMTHNKLTALPRFASIGSSLQNLFVEVNLIEGLGKDEFKGVTGLQKLQIHINRLTNIHPEAFSDCANTMNLLQLSSNPSLTSIPGEIFTGMGQLDLLNIQTSELTSFPDFSYLPDNNKLTRLWISSGPIGDLEPGALYKLRKLTFLVLRTLGLTRVPDLSRQRDILVSIALDYNFISDIPNSAFDNLPLQSLTLRNTQLTRLPDLQSVQSTLNTLVLSGNNLSTVTCEDIHEMIANYPLLNHVDLSNTNIKTFPDILKLNRSFDVIRILNPTTMRCDCALEWMIGLEDRVTTDVRGTSMPCAAPPRLVGREWSTINRMDLCQDNAAVSCHFTPPLLLTSSTNAPSLVTTTSIVTTTIVEMDMTSQDYRDVTSTHLLDGSGSSSSSPTEGSADEGGGGNILAAALGGALGVVLLIFVIVVVVLVCRMRSSSSSNQSQELQQAGEDNDAYLKIGDGNDTYLKPVSHYTELSDLKSDPDQLSIYDEIDDLALEGPMVGGAGQTGDVTGEVPVYVDVITGDANMTVYQNVK